MTGKDWENAIAVVVLVVLAWCIVVSWLKYLIGDYTKALPTTEHDDCELCDGTRGGVKGNENRFNPPWGGRTLVVCDYCLAELKGKVKS